ncbi:MAG: hypothetical protein J5769_03585 [Bacteroidales bacterium]|nr:hypothetical protein [Bacteroidales bacterium]
MKKSLICIAALALIAASCAKEMDNFNESSTIDNGSLIEYSFTAGVDTKGDLDFTTGSYSWTAGDAIAIWDSQNSKFDTFTAQADGATTEFKGSGAADAVYTNAYYPASLADATAGANAIVWPASYESEAVAAKSFPLFAVNDGGTLTFKHLGAILKISVNDVPSIVDAIEFSASKAVAGQLSVDNTIPSEPKCIMGDGASTISISTAAASRTSATSEFYMPIPTGTLTGGFTINLKQGTTVVASKATTNNVTVARAKLIKMKAFTPEGPASTEWTVAGGFNSWNTTATPMSEVLGHDGWLVARNIDITAVSGQDAGFKFVQNSTTWKGGSMSALHTQYEASGDGNITFTEATYDIYYNPTSNKFFLANAGETWIYKTIHLMCDMELTDATYYLHVWPHSGAGINTVWPGIEGSTETISGIPYHKFDIAICDGDFTSNTYDCIFHTSDDAVRYDFRDGALAADAVNSDYYASFTGKEYSKGVDGTTYGETKTNPMTQFADPAKPEGESYWGVLVGGSLTRAHWNNGPELVVNNYILGSSTELKLNFNYKWIFFGPSIATVNPNTVFSVARANTGVFTVDIDANYLCDIYINIFDKTARIVAKAKSDTDITLYFGVPNPGTYVNYYTFNGKSMSWPGVAITSNHETFNDVNYYKAVVKGSEFWDSHINLIVVSDGITDSQTHDFTTADWSGYRDAYYFLVVGKDIIQQTEAEAKWTYTSSFSGVNWSSVSWLGSNKPGYIADWKMTSDASNLYVLFKIPKAEVDADNTRYIYSGYDTDGGATGTNAGGGVNGKYNAMSLIYPFRSNPGSVSSYSSDKIESPIGTKTGTPEVHGVIRSDYAWVEMKIPRDKIGSPTGTITANHSYNWYVAGDKSITLQ